VQIDAALQNAAAGDVLLVKSGSYSGFAVANLSVAIVGDASANVQVNGTVQVRNLGASRTVVLHRLRALRARRARPRTTARGSRSRTTSAPCACRTASRRVRPDCRACASRARGTSRCA
jgi:hypothetical protein